MKNAHFWIRNISEEDYRVILKLASVKTGKASLSALARTLVLEKLANYVPSKTTKFPPKRNRLEIRLDDDTLSRIKEMAQESNMSSNQFTAMVLEQYIQKEPKLTTAEITALYQSNQQLLMIGRNLNQIAKALNSNTSAELSTKTLEELRHAINKHTDVVSNLISANYNRML